MTGTAQPFQVTETRKSVIHKGTIQRDKRTKKHKKHVKADVKVVLPSKTAAKQQQLYRLQFPSFAYLVLSKMHLNGP